MAFCTRCGATLPDGSRFCTACGTPCNAAQAPSQDSDFSAPNNTPSTNPHSAPGGNPYSAPGGNPYSAPGGNPYSAPGGNPYSAPGGNPYSAPGGNPYSAPGGNPYSNPYTTPYPPRVESLPESASRLRNFLVWNTPMLITLVALVAAGAFLGFISNLVLDDDAIVTGFFSLILPALSVSGLLMIQQQSKKIGHFPSAGLTMLQVVSIIQAVLMFIGAFGALIILFVGPSEIGYMGAFFGISTSSLKSILVLVCIILLAVFVLMGILYLMVASSCSGIKRFLLTGYLPKISGFINGCLWTIGVLSAIGALSSFTTIGDLPAYSIFSFLSNASVAGSYIVGALLCSKAKQALCY